MVERQANRGLDCIVLLFLVLMSTSLHGGVSPKDQDPRVNADTKNSLPRTMHSESLSQKKQRLTVQLQTLFSTLPAYEEKQVIVRLNTDFQPDGSLGKNEKLAQRQRIKGLQSRVLDGLKVKRKKNFNRKNVQFETVPLLVLRLNHDDALYLSELDDVQDISMDELYELSMEESTIQIGANAARSQGYTGAGQAVAVLDTGVDKTHPFLAGVVVSEACYSNAGGIGGGASLCPGGLTASIAGGSGMNCNLAVQGCDHGTHVAGSIAGNNGSLYGVAPGSKIIAINVFTNIGGKALSYSSDQIKALERVYALRSTYNIAAVNMSLGGGSYGQHCDSNPLKPIIDNLKSVGIATVIASGNNGYSTTISAPACISSAIAVGSVDDGSNGSSQDSVSSFSNSSALIDLLAPGRWITSSIPGSGYSTWQGTSMAAPHVAAAFAVIKAAVNSASVNDIESTLKASGVPVTDFRNGVVKQRISVYAALSAYGQGSVSVVISPSGALQDGGQWNLDGGEWHESGDTLSGLILGSHIVRYRAGINSDTNKVWVAPPPQVVSLSLVDDTVIVAGNFSEVTKVSHKMDANGDGKSDMFLRSKQSGSFYLWSLDSTLIADHSYIALTGGVIPTPGNGEWVLESLLDLNGDSKTDILLRNNYDGMLYTWLLDGSTITSHRSLALLDGTVPRIFSSAWVFLGAGDSTGDGKEDMYWWNRGDNSVYFWEMDGGVIQSHGFVALSDGSIPKPGMAQWSGIAIEDTNGDGKADLIWRNLQDGSLYIWRLDGKVITSHGSALLSDGSVAMAPPALWQTIGVGDSNGDGKGDLLLQNVGDGAVYLWQLNGITVTSHAFITLPDGSIPKPDRSVWRLMSYADINGDSKADVLLRNIR